jgi:hypothetical protein
MHFAAKCSKMQQNARCCKKAANIVILSKMLRECCKMLQFMGIIDCNLLHYAAFCCILKHFEAF